jgi:hypothetical protein
MEVRNVDYKAMVAQRFRNAAFVNEVGIAS